VCVCVYVCVCVCVFYFYHISDDMCAGGKRQVCVYMNIYTTHIGDEMCVHWRQTSKCVDCAVGKPATTYAEY
jgi:hypothetical protein